MVDKKGKTPTVVAVMPDGKIVSLHSLLNRHKRLVLVVSEVRVVETKTRWKRRPKEIDKRIRASIGNTNKRKSIKQRALDFLNDGHSPSVVAGYFGLTEKELKTLVG